MDKKVLYALTTKIFNTLKKLGIKPKIGVTTDIQRLPGANSFNTDLSTLTQARPESLKKVITADADFLAKANPDELRQYYNNLEYLQSNFPDIFKKPETAIEAKTGLKTLVDDVNERPAKPTKEDYDEYREILYDGENEFVQGDETFEQLDALVKEKEDYTKEMYRQYKSGKLDPPPGENSQSRMRFLRKKAEDAELTGDTRLITSDEMDELSDLESIYLKNIDDAYGADTAIKKQFKDFTSESDMIKQKYGNIIDDNLLKQILIDDNPQRKAEVMATLDEAIKMQEKGISQEEIINIIKNTTRTKQADGGLTVGIGTMFRNRGR